MRELMKRASESINPLLKDKSLTLKLDIPSDPTLAVCEGGACRGCAAHSECASNVCDVDTKTCIAESAIAYAAPSGSASSACTKSDPCTLPRALSVLDVTRNTLKLEDGTYTDRASVTTDQLVRIYGPASSCC